jgi:hypothetical protein
VLGDQCLDLSRVIANGCFPFQCFFRLH